MNYDLEYDYEVQFPITFNEENDVMNNLVVKDSSVQEVIQISETKNRYILDNEAILDLELINDEKTIISSNRIFSLNIEITIQDEQSTYIIFESVTLSFK